MRIGKLDVTGWRWEYAPGNWYKLRRIDEIIRALVFWPVAQFARVLLCAAMAAGQDLDSAKRTWAKTKM